MQTMNVTFLHHEPACLAPACSNGRLHRLQLIGSVAWRAAAANLPVSSAYQYNPANQPTGAELADGSYRIFRYEALVLRNSHSFTTTDLLKNLLPWLAPDKRLGVLVVMRK
jgi:hypothetical protein